MTKEIAIGSAIVSPLVVQVLLAVLLTGLLTWILMRLGFYKLVWQRPLVELALFCFVLAVLVAFSPDGWSPLTPPVETVR